MPKGQKPYLRRDRVPINPAKGISESLFGKVNMKPSVAPTVNKAQVNAQVDALRMKSKYRQYQLYMQEANAGIAEPMSYEEWMTRQ